MNFYRVLYRLTAIIVAGFYFWNGEIHVGIGLLVFLQLDTIINRLPRLPKKLSKAELIASAMANRPKDS